MACGSLSQDLILPCDTVPGGVFTFYVTERDNIDTLEVSGNTAVSFTLKTDKRFYNIPLKRQVGSFVQTLTRNDQNSSLYYNQQIDFNFPRLSANTQGVLQQLAINFVTCIFKDMGGKYFLIGSNNGLTMSAGTAVSGRAPGDLNGYTITIGDGYESYPKVEIPADMIEALITPAS